MNGRRRPNSTLVSQASVVVAAAAEPSVQLSVVPLSHAPLAAAQQRDPDLVQSLVLTVAAEVTRQLAATLPALASPKRPNTASAVRFDVLQSRRRSVVSSPAVREEIAVNTADSCPNPTSSVASQSCRRACIASPTAF